MNQHTESHLSAERMQAFLEGDLPARERSLAEEHLAGCARCSAELDGWRLLFTDLAALPPAAPGVGFADRVMTRVQLRAPERSWLAALFPSRPRHVAEDVLQDFVEGLLPARRVARVRAHLAACSACAHELEAWRGVTGALARLERFAPREGFAARVMAAATLPTAVAVAIRAPEAAPAPWTGLGERALVLAGRLVPRSRRAWAALSGVAVTPAAIFGLVVYVVFSHPTLTLQSLASFALWQVADLFAVAWNAAVGAGLEAVTALGGGSTLDVLLGSPLVVVGGALAYSALAAAALRVLYKNLIAGRRYARVSTR